MVNTLKKDYPLPQLGINTLEKDYPSPQLWINTLEKDYPPTYGLITWRKITPPPLMD